MNKLKYYHRLVRKNNIYPLSDEKKMWKIKTYLNKCVTFAADKTTDFFYNYIESYGYKT